MQGLAPLEFNYFNTNQVELCVTPELPFEITKGQDLASLPWTAYRRFKKSQLFKSRPSGTTLSLSEQDADILWGGIRDVLWPSVTDGALTAKQRGDVSELYFHTVSNSTVANSAFLTCDRNTLSNADDIRDGLGVNVMTFTDAWEEYRPRFQLYEPTMPEIQTLLGQQTTLLEQLSTRSQW